MNTGKIINSKTNGSWTTVPNEIIQNDELSLEEIGMLVSLLSLSPNWAIYRPDLYKRLNDKPGTIDRVFQSLQKKRYILSERVIDEKGHFSGWNHIVYNRPQITESHVYRDRFSPTSVFTEIGKSAPIVNTDSIVNTNNIVNTNCERDLIWFKNQLDDIFLDRMKLLHSGKNIELAIKESYGHLLANEIEKADKRRCQTLLNSWLSNQKPGKGQKIEEKDFLNLIK
jgi:hypothetical protein